MILRNALCLILASLSRGEEFQTAIHPPPPIENRADVVRGIFVSVERREHKESNKSFSRTSFSSEILEGKRYAVWRFESDSIAELVKLRLTHETLEALILDTKEHVSLRCMAVRELPNAGLERGIAFHLLSKAAEQPEAMLREAAAQTVSDLGPGDDLGLLLLKLLKDPCVEVAHSTLPSLIKLHDLRESSGSPVAINHHWSGAPVGIYRARHGQVVRIATLLHAGDPKLVSLEELQALRVKKVPGEEWYRAKQAEMMR